MNRWVVFLSLFFFIDPLSFFLVVCSLCQLDFAIASSKRI